MTVKKDHPGPGREKERETDKEKRKGWVIEVELIERRTEKERGKEIARKKEGTKRELVKEKTKRKEEVELEVEREGTTEIEDLLLHLIRNLIEENKKVEASITTMEMKGKILKITLIRILIAIIDKDKEMGNKIKIRTRIKRIKMRRMILSLL